MSRSAMPLSRKAAIAACISLLLASLASSAVLPWLVTPARIIAISGATDVVASPVTVMNLSGTG